MTKPESLPVNIVPIVAYFTEIALFLCVNHEAFKQGEATFIKKTLKTVVAPLNLVENLLVFQWRSL
ncbi:hypothetical protein VB711_11315 [Cronbergia sp. UHCC 0137]|uniref:hypothetical protein n=1 Tax=Cronbergia sp. UHCC 0137 TaxID=3110239 RepID=UPI002B1F819B|nr:hypothetical protein [Cronbergia sp. UHCC 0137]MEA5618423.1 hypothetical protein [Cronbergia sp. UHCC 0137]